MILISLAIMFTSCQRTQPGADLSGDYYPLGFGYEWTYDQLEGSERIRSIIEETEINGKTYYRDENDYSDYLRCENNKLYVLRDDTEYLLTDFNKPVGYEWRHPFFLRTNKILAKNVTYGSIENCIVISSESELDYNESIFAPGVGLVSSSLEGRGGTIIIGGVSRCTKAIINGEAIIFEE